MGPCPQRETQFCLWSEYEKGGLSELGASWKKGAHLWPVSYISNYQGTDCSETPSTPCVNEGKTFVLFLQSLGYDKTDVNLFFRCVVLSAESNLRLLGEDRCVFLDLFDPWTLCVAVNLRLQIMKAPKNCKPMSSAGMMNSCYPLLLTCSCLFLEQCRLDLIAEGLAKNPCFLVYSSETNWLGNFPE